MALPKELRKISPNTWELPPSYKEGMRVPARIIASETLVRAMDDGVFDQITNVARLPGIIDYAYCMPDGHQGYGFPIGGLAAFDPDAGIISPGGIGFDINCGMRLVTTNLTEDEVRPELKKLVDRLFEHIPTGVGRHGLMKLGKDQFSELMVEGARYVQKRGYGLEEDLDFTEENGAIPGADPGAVSPRAVDRGINQIGTLGSGNHYLEIQVVKEENINDPDIARQFGITGPGQVVVMFHCGSRGFGHQIASDYLKDFISVMNSKYGLNIKDRELASAPFRSPEGQNYFAAMKCAVNMAFANRQVILHRVREVFSDVFGKSPEDLGIRQIYDVAHNIAKIEEHEIHGEKRKVLVHRKGATRAFAPGMKGIPERYRKTGQPVIIGGSMETGSYLLAGVPEGGRTFFTTAHGSGRVMSRRQAKKEFHGKTLVQQMEERGIIVRTASFSGLAEEAGSAYKSIAEVADATEDAGISRKVARLVPIGNIKG